MKRFPSIKKNSEFRLVYNSGESKATRLVVMYVRKREQSENVSADGTHGLFGVRIGISVSKRVGNSVVRHTFIRRIREIFKKSIEDSGINENADIVVVGRNRAAAASFSELERDFRKLLCEHGLCKTPSDRNLK